MISEEVKQQILESIPTPRKRVWPKEKPKLVTDGGRTVGDAKVYVSPNDPNWRGSSSPYVLVLERPEGPNVISGYNPFEIKGARFHD
jgi:hypothetical protein